MPVSPVHYRIRPANPAAHLLKLLARSSLRTPPGGASPLPAWIPGSYLIREFARHVVAIRAEAAREGGAPGQDRQAQLASRATKGKSAANRNLRGPYAWDLSVRGAHLDQTHAFFNGTSVFLRVIGQEDSPCLVDLQPPEGKRFKDSASPRR